MRGVGGYGVVEMAERGKQEVKTEVDEETNKKTLNALIVHINFSSKKRTAPA
jgi:hypothetical protein